MYPEQELLSCINVEALILHIFKEVSSHAKLLKSSSVLIIESGYLEKNITLE